MPTAVRVILLLFIAILILMILIVGFIFNMMFMRYCILRAKHFGAGTAYEEELNKGSDWIHSVQPQTVEVRSHDGLKLVGHLITNRKAYRTVILFHGWRGTWDHDFAGIAKWLYDHQCNLLFIEERGHGRSGGRLIGLGIYERHDVLTWTRWLRDQVSSWHPIYLYGISMGASAVLMASSHLEEGEVNGIIADCGFTQVYAQMRRYLALKHLPEHPFMDCLNLLAKIVMHTDLRKASTIRALGSNTTPVLFFHGSEDRFVPTDMSERNYEACTAPKTLCIIEGARHGISNVVDSRAYRKKLDEFFDRNDKAGYLD